MRDLQGITDAFHGSLESLRSGDTAASDETAEPFKLINYRSPLFTFERTPEEPMSRNQLLPYTSRDNVTIHQIK
jgi:hypothetical protein